MQNIWPPRTGPIVAEAPAVRGSVRPVAGAMGAYVKGYDLRNVSGSDLGEILTLVHTYHAVMFRGQSSDLTMSEYADFGRRLGSLAVDPFVSAPFVDQPEVMALTREADDDSYNFGGDWHSDGSYLERPGGYTVLWGHEVPSHGGDTLFSNLVLAWDSLSPAYREMLDGRRCLHSATGIGDKIPIVRKGNYAAVNAGLSAGPQDERRIEHFHPIRRVHPVTGQSSLFVNQAYSVRIEGCTADESAGILGFLFDFCASPAMTARLVWEPNTIMVWDNRTTAHFAISDYGGSRREMFRLAVEGEIPVGS